MLKIYHLYPELVSMRQVTQEQIVVKCTDHSDLKKSMRYVSVTEAKQKLAALLDDSQRGLVMIRRRKRDVAVLLVRVPLAQERVEIPLTDASHAAVEVG
jgi:hypothetical protein